MKLFSLIALSALFAISYKSYQPNQSLDTHMSPDQEQDTGVNKLTPAERKELQKWINENHYVKPGAQPYQVQRPEVSEVLGGGHYIKLTDGSLWKIHPNDTPITSSWVTPANIEVEKVTGNSYTLTNHLTGSKVRATKIEKLPDYLEKPPTQTPEPSKKEEAEEKKEDEELDKYFKSAPPAQPKAKTPLRKKPKKKYDRGP